MNKFAYTWKHKIAFLKLEKEILGRNTLRGYLHDLDKLFLYLFLPKKKAGSIHRKFARHHHRNIRNIVDAIELAIDWECSRATKPDKQATAFETYKKRLFTPRQESLILEAFNILGII